MNSIIFFRILSLFGTIVLTQASGILYSIGNAIDNSIGSSSSNAYHYPIHHHNSPYAVAYSYIHAPYILPYTTYSNTISDIGSVILGLKHHHPDHKDSTSSTSNQNSDSNNTGDSGSKMEMNTKIDKADKQPAEEMTTKNIDQMESSSAATMSSNDGGSDKINNFKTASVSDVMPKTTGQLKYYTFSYPIAYTVPTPLYLSTSSQFHHQDNAGHYYYGYASQDSSKQELKANDGITRGAYSYIDADGKLQTVYYLSDTNGFRVIATNLPKSPVPVDIPDSPDVQLAKLEHMKAQKEALGRLDEANKKDAAEMMKELE